MAPGEDTLALSVERECNARAPLTPHDEGAPRDHCRCGVGSSEEGEAQPAWPHLLTLHLGLDMAVPVADAEQPRPEVGSRWCRGFPSPKAGSPAPGGASLVAFSYPNGSIGLVVVVVAPLKVAVTA